MKRWNLLGSDRVLDTKWLSVRRNTYELPQGNVIDDYFVVERDPFVLVVARREDNIVLVRQYRPATNDFYVALPAGYLKPEETPEQAAEREFMEETGLVAQEASLIGELHPLPGYIKSDAYVVTCRAGAGTLKTQDEAEIEGVLEVPWDKCLAMIRRGEIKEMQAVSAILLAAAVAENGGAADAS